MIYMPLWLRQVLHWAHRWLLPDGPGDLATAVTGIFTAGSLYVGFSILRSDRRKEERAQASRIIFWEDNVMRSIMGGPAHLRLTLNIWNRSDAPIYFPRVHFEKRNIQVFRTDAAADLNGPGIIWFHPDEKATTTLELDFPRRPRRPFKKISVTFVDVVGQEWERRFAGKRLRKVRAGTRDRRQRMTQRWADKQYAGRLKQKSQSKIRTLFDRRNRGKVSEVKAVPPQTAEGVSEAISPAPTKEGD